MHSGTHRDIYGDKRADKSSFSHDYIAAAVDYPNNQVILQTTPNFQYGTICNRQPKHVTNSQTVLHTTGSLYSKLINELNVRKYSQVYACSQLAATLTLPKEPALLKSASRLS